MSPRIFFGILLVIILGWVAAGTYASSQQLEQPVFLDHYIDEYAQDSLHMQFSYLMNTGDKNTINMVELGDIAGTADGFHGFFMEETPYVQRFGPHELRTLSVTFDIYEIRSLKEKLIFNEMTIHMSDGQHFVVDIGEVIIHPQVQSDFRLSQMSTGDDEMDVSYLEAEEQMTILGLSPHLPDEGLSALKIHIPQKDEHFNETNFIERIGVRLDENGGEDFRDLEYPIHLAKGEGFALSLQNKDNVKFVLKSWMMIEGQDENGRLLEGQVSLYHNPELTGKKVKAIIEDKGAGE
ncbi:hypothetical protein [Metaplanococcus flavidus]|uniref:Uncharacterized protein n=1 Tax=Metaplanococcus flavidus TaxID=569883 RepID=A0ABW3L6T3_9BACL